MEILQYQRKKKKKKRTYICRNAAFKLLVNLNRALCFLPKRFIQEHAGPRFLGTAEPPREPRGQHPAQEAALPHWAGGNRLRQAGAARRARAAAPHRKREGVRPLPRQSRAAASACQAGGETNFGASRRFTYRRSSSPHAARPREGPLAGPPRCRRLDGELHSPQPLRPGRAAEGVGSGAFGRGRAGPGGGSQHPAGRGNAARPLRAVAAPPLPRGQGGWWRPAGGLYLSRRRRRSRRSQGARGTKLTLESLHGTVRGKRKAERKGEGRFRPAAGDSPRRRQQPCCRAAGDGEKRQPQTLGCLHRWALPHRHWEAR